MKCEASLGNIELQPRGTMSRSTDEKLAAGRTPLMRRYTDSPYKEGFSGLVFCQSHKVVIGVGYLGSAIPVE